MILKISTSGNVTIHELPEEYDKRHRFFVKLIGNGCYGIQEANINKLASHLDIDNVVLLVDTEGFSKALPYNIHAMQFYEDSYNLGLVGDVLVVGLIVNSDRTIDYGDIPDAAFEKLMEFHRIH